MEKTTNNNEQELSSSEQTEEKAEKNEQTAQSQEQENFKEKFLRLTADFQNYKRRVEKERLEWMTEAQIILLTKILPIFEELERAINLSEQTMSEEKAEWLKGFQLIQKNWQKLFNELNIKEIDGSERFNPELHDALIQVESQDKKSGDIVELLSKGYLFKDKVVKHAKVSVAK